MGRTTQQHQCRECGATSPRWVGRCNECQAWGSLAAVAAVSVGTTRAVPAGPVSAPASSIHLIDPTTGAYQPTGLDELDRVLGGGLVPGSVILLAGEPGVGKSTLLLEMAARAASADRRALYVTGEESAAAVRSRAERIGAMDPALFLAAENDVAAVVAHVEAVGPATLIVDSIQTMSRGDVEGSAGGVTQVREVTAALIALAKSRSMATVVVGHVTKDGNLAGPRALEHLVDVVLHVEGDRHGRFRIVRAYKNRYGPADEIGCFELSDDGMWAVPDPSALFLHEGREPVSGTAVTVSLEGTRPLVTQIQALVAAASAPTRRATTGVDQNRLAMLCAVLDRHGLVDATRCDVYVATVGGVRVHEPGADLAIAAALGSSASDIPIDPRVISIGEISLAGEIRSVPGVDRRLAEAARLGFTTALVPPNCASRTASIEVIPVASLRQAFDVIGFEIGAPSGPHRTLGPT